MKLNCERKKSSRSFVDNDTNDNIFGLGKRLKTSKSLKKITKESKELQNNKSEKESTINKSEFNSQTNSIKDGMNNILSPIIKNKKRIIIIKVSHFMKDFNFSLY